MGVEEKPEPIADRFRALCFRLHAVPVASFILIRLGLIP